MKIIAVGILFTTLGLAANQPVPFEKNAVLTGTIEQSTDCQKKADKRPPELWVSVGQILLYQVEVPAKGTFEFHVVPGKYDLAVTNSAGCISQKQIEVKAKQIATADLKLEEQRKPASEAKQ